MHGMLVPDDKEKSVEKRNEWDMKGVNDIFKVLELDRKGRISSSAAGLQKGAGT